MNAPLSSAAVKLTPEFLHARYGRKIRRHISAVLRTEEDREDVFQDVLMTVFRKIDTLRDPACLDGWVAQVTANTLKYFIRQRRIRRHASWDGLTEQEQPSVQLNVHARELASRAMRIVKHMPPNDRALLARYWFSPATAESIAEESGCSIVTVRRRLFRARSRFEKLARRDPALARCFDDARVWSRRWRTAPSLLERSLVESDERNSTPS
jgi:RNA polymerase sigma-70 factor (ECF subfamily)